MQCSEANLSLKYTLCTGIFQNATLYSKAIAELKLALDYCPNLSLAQLDLGKCYIKTKQYDKAKEILERLQQEDSSYKDLYTYLGIAYLNLKKYDLAAKTWGLGFAKNPSPTNKFYYKLSKLYSTKETSIHA